MAFSRKTLAGALTVLAIFGALAFLASGFGGEPAAKSLRAVSSPLPLPPEATRMATEARAEIDRETARQARAAERSAAAKAEREADREAQKALRQTQTLPAPTSSLDPADADQVMVRAEVLKNGIALPPLESPPEVRSIIEAGNGIARTPYVWGGGHGKWQDHGYDCSGSVSFALASAGLLGQSLTSGQLANWGAPGKGKWVTIWANDGHVFLEVAGVRFDTTGQKATGSRWQNEMRSRAGFVPRHPPGL